MRAQLTVAALLASLAIVAASCVATPGDEWGNDPDVGASLGGDEPSGPGSASFVGAGAPEDVEASQGRLFACRLVAKGPTQLRYAFCRTLRGAKAAACWRYARANETEWNNWCYAAFGGSCHE
jgi:hypothetical protein